MVQIKESQQDLDTPQGKMRTYIYEPKTGDVYQEKKYPGLIFFSAIFQRTPGIERMAKWLAGHSFVVYVPEIYHALIEPGTVLDASDPKQTEKGNLLKKTNKLSTWESDVEVLIAALRANPICSGRIGVLGHCIGGHLTIRASFNPDVLAAAAFFATDVHSGTLGEGEQADTLARINDIKGELIYLWGRQDPHIPNEGRIKVYQAMQGSKVKFSWHEFNANHTFLMDNDPKGRYDPSVSHLCYDIIFDLFNRVL